MIPTAAVRSPEAVLPVARYDRLFYGGMGVLLFLIVFAGFAPTFYLRPLLGPRPTVSGSMVLSPLVYVHGFVFTTWMLLFIVQTSLIASRRVALHRRLGYAGVALAIAMIVVGWNTALGAARRGSAPPGIDSLTFFVVPLGDLVLFSVFIGAAVLRRRDKEAHKRLMLLGYISLIAAGIARIPGMLPYGPFMFFGLAYGLSFLGAAYDWWSRGTVHRVYYWGIPLLLISVPGRLMLSSTAAWQSFARYVTS